MKIPLLALLASTLCFVAHAADAQTYPERPLRWVIPFTPGGGADNLARIVGQAAGDALGQQIVIDNRAGAGGSIAAEVVAKATPDGYTLLQGNVAHAIAKSLYHRLAYDIVADFVPVTQLASIPFVLTVHPSLNVASVKELIALVQSKAGGLNFASSGNGSPSHLAMEMFKSAAHLQMRHIPYKGAAPAATDLIAGQVQMMFFTVSAALPYIKSGRLKALAIASAKRTALAPDIPTVSESGVPGFEATTWFGVMVPRGTSRTIVSKLHEVFAGALRMPDVQERLAKQGFDIVGSSPDEFARYIRAEIPKWAQVVKAAKVVVD